MEKLVWFRCERCWDDQHCRLIKRLPKLFAIFSLRSFVENTTSLFVEGPEQCHRIAWSSKLCANYDKNRFSLSKQFDEQQTNNRRTVGFSQFEFPIKHIDLICHSFHSIVAVRANKPLAFRLFDVSFSLKSEIVSVLALFGLINHFWRISTNGQFRLNARSSTVWFVVVVVVGLSVSAGSEWRSTSFVWCFIFLLLFSFALRCVLLWFISCCFLFLGIVWPNVINIFVTDHYPESILKEPLMKPLFMFGLTSAIGPWFSPRSNEDWLTGQGWSSVSTSFTFAINDPFNPLPNQATGGTSSRPVCFTASQVSNRMKRKEKKKKSA